MFGTGLQDQRREHCGRTDSRKRVLGGNTVSFVGGYGGLFPRARVAQIPDRPLASMKVSLPAPTGDAKRL